MAEFRKDPVTSGWVIVAPERAQRPKPSKLTETISEPGRCPFCSGNEDDTPPEVFAYRAPGTPPNQPGWSVRVVPNRYPALNSLNDVSQQSSSFYEAMAAHGVHEVIVESPAHVENLSTLDEVQFTRIISAYHQRMAKLSSDARWRSLLLIKNQGIAAGGSLLHVHSQLIAMPMIPPQLESEVDGAKAYYDFRGGCVYCAMIVEEISSSTRVVSVDSDYLAFCPYASRVPYETWILPRRHAACFESTAPADAVRLAPRLRETLRRIDQALDSPLFNYVIHSGPPHQGETPFYHWHIEILPRLIQIGGFEWGSGSYINTVRPEDAALLLREVAL
jgi:UDPglucose--hexose-1-phosphate uridylyltransferase